MCYLQEPPFTMEPPKKEKKPRKAKNLTGVQGVQTVLKTPEPQMIENAEPLTKRGQHPITLPQMIVKENAQPAFEQLPSYEEMEQACRDLFNGPSSMETQRDLAPVNVVEEGVAVTQDGRTVEWWPIEREFDVPNLEELALQEYLMDASKPLHTTFVLQPNAGKKSTCPMYFGNADQKQTELNTICDEIHAKIQEQWGAFACHCGLVPRLKLSQTARNPNKVFLSCPKAREERCNYFQNWKKGPIRIRKHTDFRSKI